MSGQPHPQACQPPAWGKGHLLGSHDQQAVLQAEGAYLEASHGGLAGWQVDAGDAEEDPTLDRAGEVPALDQRDLADPGCEHIETPFSASACKWLVPAACSTGCMLVCNPSASHIVQLTAVTLQAPAVSLATLRAS